MIAQIRAVLANPTNTASQSYRKPLAKPRRAKPTTTYQVCKEESLG